MSSLRRAPVLSLAVVVLAAGCVSAPARSAASTSTARREPSMPVPLSTALQDSVRRLLERAVADSAFPGAYAVVGTRAGILAGVGVGRLDWAPSPTPDEHTIWDLASLTKVVGMTSAMMQLVERGRVELDAPVQRYLPEWIDPDSVVVVDSAGRRRATPWTGPRKSAVTVRHLLTHTAGLPAFKQLYKLTTDPDSVLAMVVASPLDTVPGARMVYSDFGAILLGKLAERVSGQPLDVYLREHVFGPLGMASTMYRPDAALRARIAPTEVDPWRGRHLRGEVHDENAYALGGVSAHAGLFSTGHDLARFARMYLAGGQLDGVRVLAPETIARFTALQDSALSNRALGWEKPNGRNSAGRLMSPAAFGHTGYTGTSIWIDPGRDVFVILLTNRVNPTRENRRVFAVRSALADAVLAMLADTGAPATSTASPPPASHSHLPTPTRP